MPITTRIRQRRLLANIAVAVTVATGTVAGVALADGGSSKPPPAPVTSTQAAAPTSIASAAHQALEVLVADATIDQTQADRVQQQVDAGSVDPRALVRDSVLSDAQMQAVARSLDQVKRDAAP